MILMLSRDHPAGPNCTLGLLALGEHQWQTLERLWIPDPAGNPGGHPETSCVPPGIYRLMRHDTVHHPRTWCLVNHELGVYAGPTHGMRDSILIHPANYVSQLLGCIAIGRYRRFTDQWTVVESRIAMAELQAILPYDDSHTLEIL